MSARHEASHDQTSPDSLGDRRQVAPSKALVKGLAKELDIDEAFLEPPEGSRLAAMLGFYTGLMVRQDFEVGNQVRLKTTLDPPVNIPAGAIGSVTRVSDWDVWVRFDRGVVRLPRSDVELV